MREDDRGGDRAGGPGDVRLLTVPQAAAIMGLSRTSVYRLLETGRLPRVRMGRAVRVPEPAVDELLRQTLPPELA